MKSRSLFILFAILFSALLYGNVVYGQEANKSETPENINPQAIPDTLLFKIQQAQAAVTEVNAANKKGYNIPALTNAYQEILGTVTPVQQEIKSARKNIETKTLQSFSLIIKDASVRLTTIRNALIKSSNEIQRLSKQVIDLSGDTLLSDSVVANESKVLYTTQLQDIRLRLQEAGKLTGKNSDQISKLLADVSALEISVNDLKTLVDERILQSGTMALGKEAPYLWNAPMDDQPRMGFVEQIKASFNAQKEILSYFIGSTWDKRLLGLLLGIAFFIWVHKNFTLAKRPAIKKKIGELNFAYLRPYPILASIIILLNITPLFQPDAPSVYIEIIQLLLLIAITLHLRRVLPAKQLQSWLLVIGLYFALIVISGISSAALPSRLALLAINLAFLYMGIKMYGKIRIQQFRRRYVKFAMTAFISLNALAVILNIFGRLSLAKAFAATGVIGLTQLIGLAVFTQIVLDAIEMQIKISSCNKGIFSRVSHTKTRAFAKKALGMLAVLVWIMVFLINIGLTNGAFTFFEAVLAKQRTFGSINFTFGNILFFALIVFVANKLQKHVPLLFGEGSLTYDADVTHKSSKVALVRLIVIIIGFLLAVTASGLPMDKLTVVLGALSVGIGLGMQNIVNNFVSGIILIFDKPFRIGDYVELVDKKGKVKEIGMRASTLMTPQGSEVIIPNGDLLSGRLVNWTLSHDYLKTEILFKVQNDTNLALISKLIEEEVKQTQHVMANLPAEVLVNSIAAGSMELKVMAWVNSVYAEPAFKSELMQRLMLRFNEKEIKLV
ncbi:MAG: mechanosensitive ion channel [Pedobacter sp.]|nr:MAG: mechanosensitive ion channel [Pedobacter sp.]